MDCLRYVRIVFLLVTCSLGCAFVQAAAYDEREILSDHERIAMKHISSFIEHNYSAEMRESESLENAPEYIQEYKAYLDSKEKSVKGSFAISAVPKMDVIWQKVFLAGYPEGLKIVLSDFQSFLNNPEDLNEIEKFYFLHGPAGSGKASAARLIAMILQRPLLTVHCPAVHAKYKGFSARKLEMFLRPIVESFNPWVVCLDNADVFKKAEATEEGDVNCLSAFTILRLMQSSSRNTNMICVAAGDFSQNIPASFFSRFGLGIIYVPLPDYEKRKKIAGLLLESKRISYSDEILNFIARQPGGAYNNSQGLSVYEINDIVHKIENLLNDTNSVESTPSIATQEITYQAIQSIRGSVQAENKMCLLL